MKQMIHNFGLAVRDGFQLRELPVGAEVVHVAAGNHNGQLRIWFQRLAGDQPTETRKFEVIGTGHIFEGPAKYVGTVSVGYFIWHVLEHIDGHGQT